jgi:hypothetical protein
MIREPRSVASDDSDMEPNSLDIFQGGNGDWYLSIRETEHRLGKAVRLSTSGGASARFPGIGLAILALYNALGPRKKISELPPPEPDWHQLEMAGSELVRFCPGCGLEGEEPAGGCCPDRGRAVRLTTEVAGMAAEGWRSNAKRLKESLYE